MSNSAGSAVPQLDAAYADDRRRGREPHLRGWRALLRAVLDQAIEDYRVALLRAQRTGEWSERGYEVKRWFFRRAASDEAGMPFERLCELLALEPSRIRRGLLGEISPKGARRKFARGSRADKALHRKWRAPYRLNRDQRI